MGLSFQEIFWILLVAIVVFGPKKIPEIARGLGNGVRVLKNASDEIKREIMKEAEDINPTENIKEEINQFKTELKQTQRDIEQEIGSIKR